MQGPTAATHVIRPLLLLQFTITQIIVCRRYNIIITFATRSAIHGKYICTCEEFGKEFHVTFNDKKTTGMVFGTSNVNCKAIQVNGNNVDCVSNAKHLGNVVDDKLSDLKDINAKKVILLRVLTGLWATSEAKCLLNVIIDYFSHIDRLLQHPLWLNSMDIRPQST